MPNWCYNSLHVSGPEEDLKRWKELASSEDSPLDLNKLRPMPPEIEADVKDPKQTPGLPDWYTWRVDNWGTKWDLGKNVDVSSDNPIPNSLNAYINYTFDSAWTPPVAAIDHVVKEFPTLTFKMLYEEQGNGFVGRYYAVNGEGNDECKETITLKCDKCKDSEGRPETFQLSLIGMTDCYQCGDDYSPDDAEEMYFGNTL